MEDQPFGLGDHGRSSTDPATSMPLQIFNYETHEVAASWEPDPTGPHEQYAFQHQRCPIPGTPYDLLFSLDVRDVLVDVTIPGIDRIPLIYQVRDADFSQVAYRVLDGNRVQMVADNSVIELPPSNELEPVNFGFNVTDYDRTKAEDALEWAGVFGLDHLSDAEMDRAVEIVDELWRGDWEGRCIVPYHLYESKRDIVRGEYLRPFYQNKWFSCADDGRKCKREDSSTPGRAFATHEADVNTSLFENMSPMLVFTYCPICHCIGVENQ